jgi:hypothetical protein
MALAAAAATVCATLMLAAGTVTGDDTGPK